MEKPLFGTRYNIEELNVIKVDVARKEYFFNSKIDASMGLKKGEIILSSWKNETSFELFYLVAKVEESL